MAVRIFLKYIYFCTVATTESLAESLQGRKLLVIFFIFIFYSCNDLNNQKKIITISQTITKYDSLTYNVINKGDTNSYYEIYYGFMDANEMERTDSVLKYSYIMAEKFHYEKAYFDYLDAVTRKEKFQMDYLNFANNDFQKLKNETKKEIVIWLNKMLKRRIITIEQLNAIKNK